MHLDECFPKIEIPYSHNLFGIGLLLALAYGLYQMIITTHPSIWKVKLSIIFGVFMTFIFITFLLKLYIGDYKCSTVPNSVSGHTFVNIYFLLTWSFSYFNSGKYKTAFHRLYYYILSILLCINCVFTYLGGFHTPRQMIYGLMAAIVAAVATWLLICHMNHKLSLFLVLITNVAVSLLTKTFCNIPINLYKWNTIWIAFNIYVLLHQKLI